jgi:DNA polymerase-3 subunit alpha
MHRAATVGTAFGRTPKPGTTIEVQEVLFFPKTYSVVGVNVAEDAIVLVKARVTKRDDRISLIANDLVVPKLAQANDPAGIGHAGTGQAVLCWVPAA